MENYSHEQIQYQPETGMLFEIYDTDGFLIQSIGTTVLK